METLFAAPMRQNNNNLLDSGHQLLSDWVVDIAQIQQLNVRFEVISMNTGTEIIISHYLYNGVVNTKSGIKIIDVIGKTSIGFSRGDFDNTSAVAATVRTVGRARFSFDVVSFDIGEDVPEWDDPLPF